MLLKLVTVAALFVISVNSDGYFRDYYWRIYIDDIPSDAVEGGQNNNGTTYIGQVLDSDLSPVEIRPGHKEVYIPQEHPIARDHYISILCSNNPEKLRWYSTSAEEFDKLLEEKTVIRAGVDRKGVPSYVARVFFREQNIIGRVRVFDGQHFVESLYWSNGGYYYHQSNVYDVLVYEDPFDVKDRSTYT